MTGIVRSANSSAPYAICVTASAICVTTNLPCHQSGNELELNVDFDRNRPESARQPLERTFCYQPT